MVLAVKAILDATVEAVGLNIRGKHGELPGPTIRIGAFIGLYNIRLERLKERRLPWESVETRLDKALKLLPFLDLEKLKPNPDSVEQLKKDILKDAQGEKWLNRKLLSLKYDDGFDFCQSWAKD